MTEKNENLDDESELALRLRLHEALYKESEAWDTINEALGTITRARAEPPGTIEQSRVKEAMQKLGIK